jgi:CRISPR-associated protein Cas1
VLNILNTLYVTTAGSYVRKDHDTVKVVAEAKTLLSVPLLALSSIVCIGRVSVSPSLMAACVERGIGVSYLGENGRFLARVEGMPSGNVLLRREQYRRADAGAAPVARGFVTGKLFNCRTLLRRSARDHPDAAAQVRIGVLADGIGRVLDRLPREEPLDSIRGCEGEAAALYFEAWRDVVRTPHEALRFDVRSRRPPRDAVNAVLSFVYTLLMHDCASALASVGLDPAVGFLHTDRPGRLSLALDLMEEFRPVFADRLVFALVNRNQLHPKSFTCSETGAVTMADDARKLVITEWQKRKREEVAHVFTERSMPLGMVPLIQARLLARVLRGDLEQYPPFVIR